MSGEVREILPEVSHTGEVTNSSSSQARGSQLGERKKGGARGTAVHKPTAAEGPLGEHFTLL